MRSGSGRQTPAPKRAVALLLAAAAADCAATVGGAPPKPHIVFLFTDNMGWANVGFHRCAAQLRSLRLLRSLRSCTPPWL
eukprot:COSAG04_NODE_1662_length_6018_cov_1.781889_1_plen_79_part_10